jgi:hypothetical protein
LWIQPIVAPQNINPMPPVKQVVDEKEWGAFDSNDAV